MPKPPEKPAEPIVLSTACIVDTVYYRQGEALPYARESDLPPNLRGLIADGSEPAPFDPREIDFYHHPGPEPAGFVFQGISGGQWVSRQARQVASAAQEQVWLEQEAARANELPEEVKASLQDQHDRHSALMKAQMAFNQRLSDGIYQQAEEEASAKTSEYFVRRGGEWARVERARLKPGETTFVRAGRTANTKPAAALTHPVHRHLRK